MSWYLLEGVNAELEAARLVAVGHEVHDLRGKRFHELVDLFRPMLGSPREFFLGSPHAEQLVTPQAFTQGQWNLLEAVLIDHGTAMVLCGTAFLPCGRIGWITPTEFRRTVALPHGGRWWTDGGVGSRRPRFLVLGERLNPRARTYPFPFATASGMTMVWPWVDPRHVRVMNAFGDGENKGHPRPLENLTWTYARWYQPKVIVLGTAAAALVHTADIPFHWLAHPAFIWRFHRDSWEDWTLAFRKLVTVAELPG